MAEKKDNKTALIIVGVILLGLTGYFLYKKYKKKPVTEEKPKEEVKALKDAYENLVFETGKDVILPSSFTSLDELANVMNESPSWKLKIAGHTDSTGNASFNQTLSQKRAESVKRYLASKGVAMERMAAAGFGSTKPIADNATDEGRKQNRRVEFQISKDEVKVQTT